MSIGPIPQIPHSHRARYRRPSILRLLQREISVEHRLRARAFHGKHEPTDRFGWGPHDVALRLPQFWHLSVLPGEPHGAGWHRLSSQTGIRWYEFRGNGVPTIFQSGTVSPDTSLYRFMPSIAQDQSANAAVGYSVSSAATHPGISASYWNLTNQTTPTEIPLFSGSGDEENSYKWGDYTSMTVDPVGGCSFWYVNEYFPTNQTGTGKPIWQTRMFNFHAADMWNGDSLADEPDVCAQAVGTTSAAQTVTLTNSLSTALTINNIFGSGTNLADFGQSNDCGSSVPAGDSCTINITFTPSATGTRTASLNISDSAANSPQNRILLPARTSNQLRA